MHSEYVSGVKWNWLMREPVPGMKPGTGAKKIGGDLLSREVALRVPSALAGLTALFGMGRGVSPPVLPPKLSRTLSCLTSVWLERSIFSRVSARAPSKLHSGGRVQINTSSN